MTKAQEAKELGVSPSYMRRVKRNGVGTVKGELYVNGEPAERATEKPSGGSDLITLRKHRELRQVKKLDVDIELSRLKLDDEIARVKAEGALEFLEDIMPIILGMGKLLKTLKIDAKERTKVIKTYERLSADLKRKIHGETKADRK